MHPYTTARTLAGRLCALAAVCATALMSDKQFLEDAEKARLDISPLSGTKVQDLVQKLYAAPKDVIVRARQAITP